MYVFAAIVSTLFCVPASEGIRYQPVGGVPYSVSSLTDCRRPTGMTQCTFPADFTVPVVIADRLKIVDYDIGIYANLLKASGSMQCFEAVTNVLCDLLVQPKCLGNGMVAYEPGFPQRCNAALAKCTSAALTALKSQLRTNFCDNPSFDVAGNYSMTKCVTPNIDECINTATSPEWIAYYAEKTLASNFTDTLLKAGYTSNCAALYARYGCTLSTCGSNSQLLTTVRRQDCETIIQCAPALVKPILQQTLACNDFPTAAAPTMTPSQKNPTDDATKSSTSTRGSSTIASPTSAACSVAMAMGNLAWSLLIFLFAFGSA
ncbi:uncharacterized protein [Oscarella lobularis]|uniref:uncharacterized protein n=1 Tax=Oscarella lobularis TaxID=121494 RepID=UPI00331391A1